MKTTDTFKQVIQTYIDSLASSDEEFKAKVLNPKKNIDDCITYILNTVKKSGCNGFADEEIFGMATHYFDEENISVGKPIEAQVVVNHKVEPKKETSTNKVKKEAKIEQDLPPVNVDKFGQASLF